MLPSTLTSDEHKITAIGTSFKWKMSRFFLFHHPSDRRIWSRTDDHRPDGPVQLQQQLLQGQVPRKHVQNCELTINIMICGSIAFACHLFQVRCCGADSWEDYPNLFGYAPPEECVRWRSAGGDSRNLGSTFLQSPVPFQSSRFITFQVFIGRTVAVKNS